MKTLPAGLPGIIVHEAGQYTIDFLPRRRARIWTVAACTAALLLGWATLMSLAIATVQ